MLRECNCRADRCKRKSSHPISRLKTDEITRRFTWWKLQDDYDGDDFSNSLIILAECKIINWNIFN